MGPEHLQAFLGEGEKDVFLAGEIAVNRPRAVLDLFSHLPHRHVGVALSQEQASCRGQNGAPDVLALSGMTFSNSHWNETS